MLACPAWEKSQESKCSVTGQVVIADNGTYSGKVTIRSSGVFVSGESLRTADGQRSRAETLLHRVLPDAKVGGVSVRQLTSTSFDADIDIAATGPLEKIESDYRLAFAQDGPGLSDV